MLKVLVAEDEPWIRAAIVEMVESIGHDIKVVGDVTNGVEAWHMIQQLWPTVLITDIMMPELDGLELVRNISEEKIPMAVIIISGYENFQYAQKAITFGVNKYLLKPVTLEDLRDALFEAMEKLTEIEKMNHYLIKIQTYFDTINEIEPASGIKNMYKLVQDITTIKYVNYGAYLSLLRIVESKISSLLDSIEAEHTVMSQFSGVPDQVIRKHIGQLTESWFLHPERNKKEFKQVINSACDFIHSHYQDDLTLTQIAEYTNLSISHFGSLFKRYTGESLISYINQVRVEKAKELLRNSNDKIYIIAEEVGFSSQPYFIRVFRNITGMSPSEYRKSLGI
ncbi:two-component system response regulator YesN [Paenibacillus rhizosphaerae]|uniref:Two-component system response regulator YesN n=1 Tax=Paenibacillus rhizosphaerae TaxID=297318 RepID=A0A839THW4_9BACL|nr:response regulator [Paenibacillus rhizosphaerae]MBB3125350.1 two-component system response regulator YesN [Paenibacillus rhizosphaerae]